MGFMDDLRKLTKPYTEDEDDFDEFDDDVRPTRSSRSSAQPKASAFVPDDPEPVTATPNRRTLRFDNVSDIAEHLRSKHAVVLNLESTNKDVARRLVDFLSGCAYALDGKIKKIAISTYIITPYNVDIVGDLIDELENNGVYL